MDNNVKVSVIVPVYNAEEYIQKCIESVLAQKYENIELLLIDDGSSDSSLEICRLYAEKDWRISVYYKENGGVSSARNLGIEHSKGKYIMFCDSDDTVHENWIHDLVTTAEKMECSLVICPGDQPPNEYNRIESRLFGAENWYELFLNMQIGVVWNKIFRTDIVKNYVRFDEGLSYGEDKLFVLDYLINSRGPLLVNCISGQLYYHNDAPVSSLSKTNNPAKYDYLKLEREALYHLEKRYSFEHEDVERYLKLKKDIATIEKIHIAFSGNGNKITQLKRVISTDQFEEAINNKEILKKISPRYLGVLKRRNAFSILLYLYISRIKRKLVLRLVGR